MQCEYDFKLWSLTYFEPGNVIFLIYMCGVWVCVCVYWDISGIFTLTFSNIAVFYCIILLRYDYKAIYKHFYKKKNKTHFSIRITLLHSLANMLSLIYLYSTHFTFILLVCMCVCVWNVKSLEADKLTRCVTACVNPGASTY